MRTLEDWFKYLEQQYVDEKAEKEESKPSAEPPPTPTPTPEPEPSAEVTIQAEAPTAVQEPVREAGAEEPPATVPPRLERVAVADTAVPDPADYIFTLRRRTAEPAMPAPPPDTAEAPPLVEPTADAAIEQPAREEPADEPTAVEEAPAEAIAEAQVEEEPPAQTSAEEMDTAETCAEELAAELEEHTAEEPDSHSAEKPARAKAIRRAPYTRSVRPVPPPQSIEELWKRVPKHVRLLVELGEDEVTRRYYRREFKETRQELVERLLNPILSLEDTARLLGVCPTTVRRYTERGLLNHYRTPGNQRRFRLSDVIAFLEARQQAQEARRRRKR